MSEAPGASAIPAPGDVLAEKYSITRVIGQGGMGCVVAARHLLLDQEVAIKFLLPQGADDPQFVKRFLREAQTAASIRSEHVVRVLDMGVLGDGVPYMVMEYLDGEDLGARVDASGPLPIEDAVELTLQACEALAEAHASGLTHRDIKPSNLFVTRRSDGSPLLKLLDFGIAKRASSIDGALTATGVMMGSPSYMSPEQVRDAKTVDGRTDIWSLGATLYELLTGDPPFMGTTFSALCAAIISDAAPPLREKRADVPAELEAAILRCLEKEPAKRFADVGALAEAIAPFAGSLGHVSAGRTRRVLSPSAAAVEGKTNLASASRVSAAPSNRAAAEPFAQTEVSSTTALGEGRRSAADEPRSGRSRALALGALLAVASGAGVFVALMRNTTETPATPSSAVTGAPSGSTNAREALAPTLAPTANTPVVTAASADVVAPSVDPTPSAAPLNSPSGAPDAGPPPSSALRPAAPSSATRPTATSVPTTTPKKGPANADPFADQH